MNNGVEFDDRKHPAHPSPVIRVNRPTIVFLTLCVEGRRPLLANDHVHSCLMVFWAEATHWLVGRYMIMPDHIHLFCAPSNEDSSLKLWVQYWRNAFTKAWPHPQDKPIWQRDYWDRQIRRGESYSEKWAYVEQNPVRAGLVNMVQEWPYQGELNVLRW